MTKPHEIRFIPGGNLSKSFVESLDAEWLETNGLGGYASSTISRCATRKHHGLLVHPLPRVPGRFLILSDLEPEILFSDRQISLGSNTYGRTNQSGGYRYLKEFKPFPNPAWLWGNSRVSLREEMIMPRGQLRLLIRYHLSNSSAPLRIRLKPLLGYRDSHGLTSENADIRPSFRSRSRELALTIYPDMPKLYFSFSGDYSFQYTPFWDKGVTYRGETREGDADTEDRFVPGLLFLEIRPGKTFTLSVGMSEFPPGDRGPEEVFNEEKERRLLGQSRFSAHPPVIQLLGSRVEQFLIKNEKGVDAIVAGYPWLGEWCRDTMIALPGLTLAVEDKKTAAGILEAHASYLKRGLMPTAPPRAGVTTSYDSLDAALLYIAAIQASDPILNGSRLYSGEREFEKRFYGPVKKILTAFFHNRVPRLRLDEEGLLTTGAGDAQPTRGRISAYGKPNPLRHDKASDINALWYNALCYFMELQTRLGKKIHRRAEHLVQEFPSAFRKTFWLPQLGYLADHITPEGPDSSLRSNMLLALALPYSPLTREESREILKAVKKELLTPMGIRTLSLKDPRFLSLYEDSGDEEESAYYRGSVRPGTLELFILASLRTNPGDHNLREGLKRFLVNLLEEHLLKDGLGCVSEIFDGKEPGRGKGCIAHAESAAAILRSWKLLKEFPKA